MIYLNGFQGTIRMAGYFIHPATYPLDKDITRRIILSTNQSRSKLNMRVCRFDEKTGFSY